MYKKSPKLRKILENYEDKRILVHNHQKKSRQYKTGRGIKLQLYLIKYCYAKLNSLFTLSYLSPFYANNKLKIINEISPTTPMISISFTQLVTLWHNTIIEVV